MFSTKSNQQAGHSSLAHRPSAGLQDFVEDKDILPPRNDSASSHQSSGSSESDSESIDDEDDDYDEDDEDDDIEPFETYKIKVIQLCRDLGYGEPLLVEKLRTGWHNRAFGLRFSSGDYRNCVLRVARFDWTESDAVILDNDVSVLRFASQFAKLLSPTVVSFDRTAKNALEHQYILLERCPGSTIQDAYYTLPLSEQLKITTLVAQLIAQIETIQFDTPGRLLPIASPQGSKVSAALNDIEIGGFEVNLVEHMPKLEKQPLTPLIIQMLEYVKPFRSEKEIPVMCEKLQIIAKEMEHAGFMRVADSECALWHPDFFGDNILIDWQGTKRLSESNLGTINTHPQDANSVGERQTTASVETRVDEKTLEPTTKAGGGLPTNSASEVEPENTADASAGGYAISGLIDWDYAKSVPLVLSRRAPSWLWSIVELREHISYDPDDQFRDLERHLSQDELTIKAHFDQTMQKLSPSYIEDAYHRGPWIRELAFFAMSDFGTMEIWKRYDRFVKRWEEYYATIAKPELDGSVSKAAVTK